MNAKDISTIHRFLGVLEGVALALPENAQSLVLYYIEVVDNILDKEEKGGKE